MLDGGLIGRDFQGALQCFLVTCHSVRRATCRDLSTCSGSL
jgi:hypothetical protein